MVLVVRKFVRTCDPIHMPEKLCLATQPPLQQGGLES